MGATFQRCSAVTMNQLVKISAGLVNSSWFEYFIIAVIIANGVLLGLETRRVHRRRLRTLVGVGKPGRPGDLYR